MKCILKYPGAKNRLAPWICSYIPKHTVYLEPFGGSLAVLFQKSRSRIETVNDLDGEIVNFFQVLRDYPDELHRKITLTPYSRIEYENAYEKVQDPIERARRYAVRCWMAFGCGNRYQNGFRCGMGANSPNPAKAWKELGETIFAASKRLQGVQIEHMPALELISRHQTSGTVIYVDPPYLPDIRKKYLYVHEMEVKDHQELVRVLKHHPAKILLSGYENPIYKEQLSGWNKVTKRTQAEGGRIREETLWMNYEPDGKQLEFHFEEGA